jgi:hypothetical protein
MVKNFLEACRGLVAFQSPKLEKLSAMDIFEAYHGLFSFQAPKLERPLAMDPFDTYKDPCPPVL